MPVINVENVNFYSSMDEAPVKQSFLDQAQSSAGSGGACCASGHHHHSHHHHHHHHHQTFNSSNAQNQNTIATVAMNIAKLLTTNSEPNSNPSVSGVGNAGFYKIKKGKVNETKRSRESIESAMNEKAKRDKDEKESVVSVSSSSSSSIKSVHSSQETKPIIKVEHIKKEEENFLNTQFNFSEDVKMTEVKNEKMEEENLKF